MVSEKVYLFLEAKESSKLEIVTEMLRKCVEENAHSALDQAEY